VHRDDIATEELLAHVYEVRSESCHIQSNAQVVSHGSVDSGATIVKLVVGKNDQDGVLSLLALHEHGVTTEELQSLHGVVGQVDDACASCQWRAFSASPGIRTVIVIGSIGDGQAVGLLLLLQDSSRRLVDLVEG
jgi:hypothetical protein